MALPTRSFTQIMGDMSAVLQGTATGLIDLSVGSVLRALLEANASLALWIQWLALKVLQTTRAATSSAADLDSWMQDFSVTRLSATAAVGSVTFARFVSSAQAIIPVGSLVKTGDGSQTFAVTVDMTNQFWASSVNGYAIPSGASSITVPVAAQRTGSLGNIQPGVISMIASALPGVDTVVNMLAMAGGLDQESDAAFRARSQSFMASRSRATLAAVGYAIASLQQGLSFVVNENVDASGAIRAGSFVVTVDDGSGNPSSVLLAAVSSAIDAIRPVGSMFAVRAPTVILANISLTVTVSQGTQISALVPTVQAALDQYINSLPIEGLLSTTRIAQVAYSSTSLITNVSAVTINSQPGDLAVATGCVVKAGAIMVA